MRNIVGITAAVACGSACLFLGSAKLTAQIVNPTWESPTDLTDGTSTTVDGWAMSPAPNPDFGYTNNGQRDAFYNSTPGGRWSFWLQTFTQSGDASQVVTADDGGGAITPGLTYTFGSLMSFQDGSGPGQGYNAVTLANQTEASPPAPNTGDMYSYLEIVWQNSRGNTISTAETDIAAGSVAIYNQTSGSQAGATLWEPYSVSSIAPTGAASAELIIGWANGGLDGNTGGQSAFADDATFNVPEPASLGLLAVGGMALLGRRRRGRTA
jgi:PEP-CTERM motif